MVDGFLVAGLLGLNETVSVFIWSEQDIFYITLSGTNINIHCYLTTFLLFTICLVLLHLKNCQKLVVTFKNISSGKRLTTDDVCAGLTFISNASLNPHVKKKLIKPPF